MIILQMFDMFLYLVKQCTSGDFVMTFSYFALLALFFNALRSLLRVA